MPTSSANQENEPPKISSHKKLKTENTGRLTTSKSSEDESDASPKRFKAAKNKAKLSLLPSLPLDVLFEIFGHLAPVDILNLARATKDLRRILMHKSAVSIWKASFCQMAGLPQCPDDMPQPAWANLAFSAHCHHCFAHRVQKVDWLLRIRLCGKCIKTSDVLRSDKHLNTQTSKLDKIVSQCVPFSSTYHVRGHKGRCCIAQEERKFLQDLQAAKGNKSEFVKTRKQAIEARKEHAEECEAWVTSLNRDRWDELEEIRDKRRDDIYDKLEALGFTEELDYLEDHKFGHVRPALLKFDDHPDVKVNKPLTERSWKNMEQRLTKYMNEVKAHRLAAERLKVIRQRERLAVSSWVQFRMKYPPERLLPSGTDILSWDKIKAIIELPSSVPLVTVEGAEAKNLANSSEVTVISPASFTRVFQSMSVAILQWEEERICQLGGSNMTDIRTLFHFSPVSSHLRDLQLAACVFTCEDKPYIHSSMEHYQDGSYPILFYPEFLHHPCNTVARREYDDDRDAPFNPLFKASKDFGYCRRKEWATNSIFFDEKASRAVKRILEVCGLDYMTTTAEKMDDLDPWFICLKCSYGAKCDGQRPRKVMSWRNAVQHCMLVHWGDRAVTWEKITEESAQEARALSAVRSIACNVWRCAHCRDSSVERDGKKTEELMRDHLYAFHNIRSTLKDRDYYRALDFHPPAATVQIIPKVVRNGIDSCT